MTPSTFVIGALVPLALVLPAPASASWSTPETVGRTNWPALSVAAGEGGHAGFAWLVDLSKKRTLGERTVIRARLRSPSGRYGAMQTVSPRGLAHGPSIAVDRRGDAVVVWSETRAGGQGVRVFAAIRRRGHRFDPARPLGRGRGLFAATPRLAMNARGDAVVAWRSSTTRVLVTYRRAGRSFGTPQTLISPPVQDALEVEDPAVAIDRTGRAYVAWASAPVLARRQPPRGLNGVRFAARGAAGRFGTPQIVSRVGEVATPALATGRDGTVALVWRAESPTGDSGIDAAIRPPGGTFGPPERISRAGDTSGVGVESAFAPRTVLTPGGEAVAAWAETRYMGRLGPYLQVGTAAAPPGGGFAPPAAVSAQGATSGEPALAVGATGETAVVWQESGAIRAPLRPPGGGFGPAQAISERVSAPAVPTVSGGRTIVAGWFHAGRVQSATWAAP